MQRTILIDGDIVAYQHATQVETPVNWGDDLWTLHADAKEAKAHLVNWIEWLKDKTEGTSVEIFLSDSNNFRKTQVDSSYKSNRADKRKPVILGELLQWMRDELGAKSVDNLEADDAIGIAATKKRKGECVMASIDKDFATIPGLHFNWNTDIGVFDVEPEDADYNFYLQCLTGDATDGYAGCPGIGPKRAAKILEDAEDYWSAILVAYEKAGFGEDYALSQARLARILRNTDYNHKKKEVILWTPN